MFVERSLRDKLYQGVVLVRCSSPDLHHCVLPLWDLHLIPVDVIFQKNGWGPLVSILSDSSQERRNLVAADVAVRNRKLPFRTLSAV